MASRILPGKMWFLTRRVVWRTYRLRPGRKLNGIVRYVIFKVAKKYKIRVTALCVMSNHWHAVVGVPGRDLPAFLQSVNSELARSINAAYGDFGSLWERSSDTYRLLPNDEAVLRAISYTMNNPVTSGGVRFARKWPGVRLAWPTRTRVAPRAQPFYRTKEQGGTAERYVVCVLSRPFGFEGKSDAEVAKLIREACKTGEKKARDKVLANGGTFRKPSEILRGSRDTRSVTFEKRFDVQKRIIEPDDEERKKLIEFRRQWNKRYKDALAEWPTNREVPFPYGTYKMVRLHEANMDPPSPIGV